MRISIGYCHLFWLVDKYPIDIVLLVVPVHAIRFLLCQPYLFIMSMPPSLLILDFVVSRLFISTNQF